MKAADFIMKAMLEAASQAVPRTVRAAIAFLALQINCSVTADAGGLGDGSPAAVQSTQVIRFRPAVPKAHRQAGECWTDSAAVDRAEAWRCVAGNEIYDPCFALAELKDAVVCGADPARRKPGFVLELAKPLPERSPSQLAEALPWMLKLADGSVCELTTGTSAQVDGQDVPYECSDSRPCSDDRCAYLTGVTTNLKRGAPWRAEKVAFRSSRGEVKLLKRRSIAVVTAWQ